MKRQNLLLLSAVVALGITPFVLHRHHVADTATFEGSDGQAGALIGHLRPDYAPWAESVWTPPSKEIESLLFGLQAAAGAGVIGYVLGFYRGKRHDSAATR